MTWKTPAAQQISARKRYDRKQAAPDQCANTDEGLTTNDLLGVEMATADVTPASGSMAARLDGCPGCVDNTEVPFGAFRTPAGSLVALYRCSHCGHRWHTAWNAEVA